jgi:hypothetical protein
MFLEIAPRPHVIHARVDPAGTITIPAPKNNKLPRLDAAKGSKTLQPA